MLPFLYITREDILSSEDVFGNNMGTLEGKTVATRPNHTNYDNISISPQIMTNIRVLLFVWMLCMSTR